MEGSYALRALKRARAPASLVRLVSYTGADSRYLRIELQRTAVLSRLPGGAKVVQHLQDGLGMLRIQTQARTRPARRRLTDKQISDGLGRLLEHREGPAEWPSLWE